MADPIAPRTAHTNAALSDFASAYVNSQFIGDELSPAILTDKLSDVFYKRLRKDQADIVDDYIGPRGQHNEATYELDTSSYSCKQRGLKHPVTETLRMNADAALSPDEAAVANIMQKIKLAREDRIASQVMTAANWAAANTGAVGNYWTDETNGTPLSDLQSGLEAIPFNGEDVRVVGVCSDIVWNPLSRHPTLHSLRAGGGTDDGTISTKELARYLGIDDIFVSKIHKNTANLGQTASYSRVWGTTTFAFVVVPRVLMSTEQMMFSATFRWNVAGGTKGVRAREWHKPDEGFGGTDYKAVELADDEVIVQNDAGYLFTAVKA